MLITVPSKVFKAANRGHARLFRTVPPAITLFLVGE
jgi:hypothetical protein